MTILSYNMTLFQSNSHTTPAHTTNQWKRLRKMETIAGTFPKIYIKFFFATRH